MGRHHFWYLAPSAERIALLGRFGLGRDGGSILHIIRLVGLAVHYVGQFITVDAERTCHRHIVGRHHFWYFAPSAERIAFFGRFGLGRDGGSILYIIRLVDLAVHHIGQRVGVDSE